MVKKFFLFFALFFLLSKSLVLADSIPVENIFSDISKDYKYYNELQTLYDKWMIFPDNEWKFNPQKLLNRDEFVWIMMEVSCKKCISPNASYDFISKYQTEKLYFDISNNNKYFYCVAWAKDLWYVKWYHESSICENWDFKNLEKPFCPNNTIILEEAIAMILRASWILTNSQADKMRLEIAQGKITEKLLEDVSPLNSDGSVYSFYPDIKKAIEYSIVDFDKNWNEKVYNLLEVKNWKIRPKQAISKEDFLRIAFVALKANSCQEKIDDKIWLKIEVFNKICNETNIEKCVYSSLVWKEKIYDFNWEVWLQVWDTIDEKTGYIWRFYNYNTWKEIKKYWKYIDNYDFLEYWKYRVYLRVITKEGKSWEVFVDFNLSDNDDFKVSIDANPIFWDSPLLVNFKAIVSWDAKIKSYFWEFWDGSSGFWKEINHFYKNEWVYKARLRVIDINNNIVYSTVLINVTWKKDDIYSDFDLDWINDLEDACPDIKWVVKNKWCPIFDKSCELDSDCNNWYYCAIWWICSPKIIEESCEYSWWDLVYGNVVCNSCPCSNKVDFNSVLRKCDIIFPAITSPTQDMIYSKWEYFQIK